MSLKESINNEIETRFYYIDYPGGTPESFGKMVMVTWYLSKIWD